MIVVDTSALFAILNKEESADVLTRTAVAVKRVAMSTGTATEVAIVVHSRMGEEGLERLDLLLSYLQVELHDLTSEQSKLAVAGYRAFGRGSGSPARLNFGDCFSYALAKSLNVPLLFVGDDFIHTDIAPAMKPS